MHEWINEWMNDLPAKVRVNEMSEWMNEWMHEPQKSNKQIKSTR